MASREPCATHRERRAGWRCARCGARCPDCVAERAAGYSTLDVCIQCGAMAEAIRERRSVQQPFLAELPWALLWPVRGAGPIMLFAWGSFLAVARIFHGGGFGRGLLLAYLFHVTRWTAHGNDDVPGAADFRGFFEDVVAPMTRLTLGTIWVTAPLILMLWWGDGPANPALIALVVLVGLALVPISLLASSVGTPLRHIVNPLVLGGYAIKLGSDYVALLVACAVGAGLYVAVTVGAAAVLPDNFLVALLINTAALIFPFAFFRALGLLLRARGDDLGYGPADDYLVNVLGDVKPRGMVPEAAAPEPPAPIAPEAIEVAHAPNELLDRLRSGDAAAALDLFEGATDEIPPLTLSAEGWLNLGKAGAQHRRFQPALIAFRRAIDVAPQGPTAPQAWLLAARIYDEGLGNREQSDRLLGELARRFPESQEGQFAARRLAAVKSA